MRKLSWFGIALVLVGTVMLLRRLDVVQFSWQVVVWLVVALFGIVKCVDGFSSKKSGRVFWGTSLFLLGLYNVMRDLDLVELRSYWIVPAILVIVGLSILMMFINSPREWHLLIPSVVLLGIGAAMILTEFGYLYQYDVVEWIRIYWPVGLILFGIALVVRRIPSHPKL